MAKRRKPLINRTTLTARQQKLQDRAAELNAEIALDQQKAHDRILDAVRDTFDNAVADADGEAMVHAIFSLFARAATTSNAKRIVSHPDCPAEVVEEVETRIEERRKPKASPAPRKTNAGTQDGPEASSPE